MVQKDITLKQVLNKIKDMDEKHKVEWVYSLLKEFGSEVASKLYHEGYEQGKFDEALKFSTPKEKYYYVAVPIEYGRYKRLGVLSNSRVCLLDNKYESIELLKEHSAQSTGKLTEQMIKESELAWAWQFAKELED